MKPINKCLFWFICFLSSVITFIYFLIAAPKGIGVVVGLICSLPAFGLAGSIMILIELCLNGRQSKS